MNYRRFDFVVGDTFYNEMQGDLITVKSIDRASRVCECDVIENYGIEEHEHETTALYTFYELTRFNLLKGGML